MKAQVDGLPPVKGAPSVRGVETPLASQKESVRILVDLRISNGLHIHQKNLSYQSLRSLIEKLEAQCLDVRLKYANSSRFGDKRKKVRKDLDKAEEPDSENL